MPEDKKSATSSSEAHKAWDHLRCLAYRKIDGPDDVADDLERRRIFITARTELATQDKDDIEDALECLGDDAGSVPFTCADDLTIDHIFHIGLFECISLGDEGYRCIRMGPAPSSGGKEEEEDPQQVFTLIVIDSSNPMGQVFRGSSLEPCFGYYDGTVEKSGEEVLPAALDVLSMLGDEGGASIGELRAAGSSEIEHSKPLMPAATTQ